MARQRILVDTTLIIDHLRKKRKDKTFFFQLSKDCDCFISAITLFEFSVGSTSQNREFADNLLAILPVLPFDSACTQQAVKIYQTLKSKNQLISLPDVFIAATAMAHNLPLHTLNRKHFDRIKDLRLGAKKR